ncbi:MAG: BatA domain-containing protein, partial [Acidobacteria bacterium]|nr:BatA domain-containing protein [Acidobacteriota bacterium]
MTWLAPWAFAGLVALAGPLLVHWLARHQADRLRFPTLQFLVHAPPVSVRRHRVRDVPLLVVRSLIVVAAVAALAQPVLRGPAAPAAQPARAIVLDTSVSLQRPRTDGRAGAAVAREAIDVLAAEARREGAPVLVDPAADVAAGVARAAAWLARQPAPRELVVVSDFQVGALVAADLDVVPADAGVRLVPVPVSGPVPAAPAPARGALRVLAGAADTREAAAAQAAARALVP